MAVKKKANTCKAVVWTETSRSEMEGPTKAIAYYLFMYVPQEDRQQLLEDMRAWDEQAKTD